MTHLPWDSFQNTEFEKCITLLSSTEQTLIGVPFWDTRTWASIKLLPGYDRLRTANALRPGLLRNTWPARPLGQPRTSSFRKYHRARRLGSRQKGSCKTYGPVLRAGVCRPRCAACKRPPCQVRLDTFDRAGGKGPGSTTKKNAGTRRSF